MPSATYKRPYIRNHAQEEPFRGITSAEEGLAVLPALTSIKKTIRIRSVGGQWWLDLNDGTAERVLTGTYYDPLFRVRAVSIKDDDGYIVFDTPDSEGVTERLGYGVDRAFEITRLHFGSANTTARDINLHG